MRFARTLSIALLFAATTTISASDRTVTIQARVTVSERTSLTASTDVLRFVVAPGVTQATASVEFTAGVRTQPGREVVVVVEPGREFDRPLSFNGDGEGVMAGVLPENGPAVVARYIGGGQRRGRLVFTIGGVTPGIYTVPIRLHVTVL